MNFANLPLSDQWTTKPADQEKDQGTNGLGDLLRIMLLIMSLQCFVDQYRGTVTVKRVKTLGNQSTRSAPGQNRSHPLHVCRATNSIACTKRTKSH